jgi:uncharacterized membrane protein YbhN (UPF0104 family)
MTAPANRPPPAVPTPPPPPRRGGAKKWVLTLLKVAIAVVGIWFVLHRVRWDDTATLPAHGPPLRGVTFNEDVEVTVLPDAARSAVTGGGPTTVRIRFPKTPVKVHIETADAAGRDAEMVVDEDALVPGTQQRLNLPAEMTVPRGLFKQEDAAAGVGAGGADADPIKEGLRSLLISASGKWYLLLAAWALLGVPFLVTAVRWRNLMRPQGINMPLGKCLQLTFVGQFYSIMLPGITGGDLVKIVYAARLTGSKTKSFITIILDRVIGLVALMVIAGTSAGVQLALNARNPGDGAGGVGHADNTLLNVFVMIVGLLAVLATGAAVYFSHRLRRLVGIEWFVEHFGASDDGALRHEKLEHLFRVVNMLLLVAAGAAVAVLAALRWGIELPWAVHNSVPVAVAIAGLGVVMLVAAAGLVLHEMLVRRATPVMGKLVEGLVRVDETLHVYRGHFGLLAWAFLISVVSQLTLPLSAWLSGLAFGMRAPVTHYLAYVPVAVLAASMPVSPPQGFGVMDWLLTHFFAERGTARVSQAFALAQAVRFLPMVWNLMGAYWVVTGSYSRHQVQEEEKTLGQAAPGSA